MLDVRSLQGARRSGGCTPPSSCPSGYPWHCTGGVQCSVGCWNCSEVLAKCTFDSEVILEVIVVSNRLRH